MLGRVRVHHVVAAVLRGVRPPGPLVDRTTEVRRGRPRHVAPNLQSALEGVRRRVARAHGEAIVLHSAEARPLPHARRVRHGRQRPLGAPMVALRPLHLQLAEVDRVLLALPL
eukprot:7355643-Pyramimonas_sp.AAC.1